MAIQFLSLPQSSEIQREEVRVPQTYCYEFLHALCHFGGQLHSRDRSALCSEVRSADLR